MSPSIADVQTGLDSKRLNPGPIRDRIPADLSPEKTRAVVCAIRNPDAAPHEAAAKSGTDEDDLFGGLAVVAKDRYPLTESESGVQAVLYRALADAGQYPEDVLNDEDTLRMVARRVGREADAPSNPSYIGGLLSDDGVRRQIDAKRIDGIVIDRRKTAISLAEITEEIGLRRVLTALGERPPPENLDRLMASTPSTTDAETGITTDYEVLPDTSTAEDIKPGTPYYAEVNNKEPYGIFVSLGGRGYEDISGLVHKNHLPSMLSVGDFRKGDEVMVRLIKRRADGDLGFELIGIIDALNADTQEFPAIAEVQDVGSVAGVDEEALLGQAETAGEDDATEDGEGGQESASDAEDDDDDSERAFKPIQPETSHHEVLHAIATQVSDGAAAVSVPELHDHFEGIINSGTVGAATTTLYNRTLLDREEAETPDSGGAMYVYTPSDAGEEMLADLGRPERVADSEADSDASDAEEEEASEPEPEPDPKPTMTTPANEPTGQPDSDADFTGDVQMMAGMAIGRGDLTAEEAAASLREVADRLESGGPSTWR